ncbi:MAG: RNA 2',3'-cyclic phosphodiesterase [Thermodesulfovibrionales bacterium]|nr:RNA 2',3'-cyclic phosphodiesterase [Thermodesulfovibrionales bacterium]
MGLRCFIALELPEEVKKNIYGYVEKLKAAGADVKWVRTENLHLTLKFLEDTTEELLKSANERLISLSKSHNRFSFQVSGAGAFPNIKYPKVIWLGVHDSEEIVNLQHDIDESMAGLGFEKDDKQFTPHLTIGRVKSMRNKDALIKELITLKEVDFGKIEVLNITLMKSELKPGGAEHFKLSEIPIGKEI